MTAAKCEHCGYDLAGLPAAGSASTCPECGKPAMAVDVFRVSRALRLLAGGPTVISCIALFAGVFTQTLAWIAEPSDLLRVFFWSAVATSITCPVLAAHIFRRGLSVEDRRVFPTIQFVMVWIGLNAAAMALSTVVYFFILVVILRLP